MLDCSLWFIFCKILENADWLFHSKASHYFFWLLHNLVLVFGRKLCCATVKSLFMEEGKHDGEATLEAVKMIAELVKSHNCQLHPDSVEVRNLPHSLRIYFVLCFMLFRFWCIYGVILIPKLKRAYTQDQGTTHTILAIADNPNQSYWEKNETQSDTNKTQFVAWFYQNVLKCSYLMCIITFDLFLV